MPLLEILQGTLVNGVAIIIGTLAGVLLGRFIPERLNEIALKRQPV